MTDAPQPSPARATADERRPRAQRGSTNGPWLDSEITWLLHRAAQRMNHLTSKQAEAHGLQLRDYIVLSALHKTPHLTQRELGRSLGLDKSTLMKQLDRLERMGLVERLADPRDRRIRIPQITDAGQTARSQVAVACASIEALALAGAGPGEEDAFRRLLIEIIGDSDDPGSCL
jgi:DNA-binding MarR family transcriptional regulator